jgi:imidazole glycerol-phosphate synthase subunit HisF
LTEHIRPARTTLLPRLISALLIDEGRICRTKNFETDYFYTDAFLDFTSFDEIMLIDVTRQVTSTSRQAFARTVEKLLGQCFLPVTLGGHLRNADDAARMFRLGADRVLIGSSALEEPQILRRTADAWGSQAVIAAVNVVSTVDGSFRAVTARSPGVYVSSLPEALRAFEEAGAGEVLVNSVDRDGSLRGYDSSLASTVADTTSLPYVLVGGAGNWKHLAEGIAQLGASGVATSNIYHQTSQSIHAAKQFLQNQGVRVRLEPRIERESNA